MPSPSHDDQVEEVQLLHAEPRGQLHQVDDLVDVALHHHEVEPQWGVRGPGGVPPLDQPLHVPHHPSKSPLRRIAL